MSGEVDPELWAALEFVEEMVPQADHHNPFPLWHGWALREAFLAGVKWQREVGASPVRPLPEGSAK